MLKFNTVLQEAGFDPKKVFLLRHEDERVRGGIYQAWKSRRRDFETYQNSQKWQNHFEDGSSLASFAVGANRETLFVGMYDVLTVTRVNGPSVDPLLGELPAEDRAVHETRYSERMQDYEERLVVDWGPSTRTWRQLARNQNKPILEIRAQASEPAFPRYVDLHRRLGDLANIYPSWQKQLAAARGVYLLTFDDGTQYVGSATGQEGFWQRWEDYLSSGHGGNVVLLRDERDARTAMVSIPSGSSYDRVSGCGTWTRSSRLSSLPQT